MSLREIYTSISRAKQYDDLNLTYTDIVFKNDDIDINSSYVILHPIKNKQIEKKKDNDS